MAQTDRARSVLRAGRWLASATGRALTICHIRPPSNCENVAGTVLTARLSDGEVLDEELGAFVSWLGEDARPNASITDVEIALGCGIPAIEIERIASGRNAAVIVMGHGNSSEKTNGTGGSVSDSLVRISTTQIWFTAPGQTMIERIVAGVDGTERGTRVLDVTSVMAARLGAFLDVVTVIPPADDSDGSLLGRPVLRPRSGPLSTKTQVAVSIDQPIEYRHGEPVEKILEFAEERSADVVAVGVRRGGPPKRIDPTQIARSLLAVAPKSVFTIPI